MKRESKQALDFSTAAKRRIYMDLDVDVIKKADARAAHLRLPRKRYIEVLIERDCAKK